MAHDAAFIFFTDGHSVLLLKREGDRPNPKCWSLPGGRKEKGETPIQTAKRESIEECGKIAGKQFDFINDKDSNLEWVTFFFWVKNKFDCTLSEEHSKYRWIALGELDEYKLHPKLKDNLKTYLRIIRNYKNGVTFKEWLLVK